MSSGEQRYSASWRRRCLFLGGAVMMLMIVATAVACVVATADRPLVITIRTSPPAATVFEKDEYLGTTPLAIKLMPGERRTLRLIRRDHEERMLVLRADDFQPETFRDKCRHLLFGTHASTPSVVMQSSLTARFSISSNPSGSAVFLDGYRAGVAPLSLAGLDPRTYALRIQKPDFQSRADTVELAPGKETFRHYELESKWVAVYRQRIVEHPEEMTNYAELAHDFVLRGRFDDAEKVLRKGLDVMTVHRPTRDRQRFLQELQRIYVRQYIYPVEGADESIRPACRKILEAMLKTNAGMAKTINKQLKVMDRHDRKRR